VITSSLHSPGPPAQKAHLTTYTFRFCDRAIWIHMLGKVYDRVGNNTKTRLKSANSGPHFGTLWAPKPTSFPPSSPLGSEIFIFRIRVANTMLKTYPQHAKHLNSCELKASCRHTVGTHIDAISTLIPPSYTSGSVIFLSGLVFHTVLQHPQHPKPFQNLRVQGPVLAHFDHPNQNYQNMLNICENIASTCQT
jgi:hypothetical protein